MMKTFLMLAMLAAVLLPSAADARGGGAVRVRGHVTKTGRYVPPHVRTAPNRSKFDNYSTRGNVNPYTGKEGKR